MDIGGEESKGPGVDGSWIPRTPGVPIRSKPHVVQGDGQGNHNPAIWCEPDGCPAGCLPTSNGSYLVITEGQDSVPHDNVQQFQFTADNMAASWNHISFGSLLDLANAASGMYLGATTPWNHGFPFPASQWNTAAYTPDSQLRYADVRSDSITPHFEPVTPEKSMRTERRQITNLLHSCRGEGQNEETRREESAVVREGPAVEVLESGKEIQRQATATSLDAASSLPEYQSMDDGGNHESKLNNTPQQKPKRKKHRPKVITEGKPRTRKNTEKADGSKETPGAKRKHAKVSNTATPCSTSGTSEVQAINHKMQESSDSKEAVICKRKYVRRNKVPTTSLVEEIEASDATTISSGNTEENQGSLRQNPKRRAQSKMSTPPTELVDVPINQEMAEDVRKTCRRALNFDVEGLHNESLRCSLMHGVDSQPKEAICAEEDQTISALHLGFQIDLAARKSGCSFAPDMKKEDDSSVQREAPSVSASLKTSHCLETVEVNSSEEHAQGNQQVVAPNHQESSSQITSEVSIQSSHADISSSSLVRFILEEKAKELESKIYPIFEQPDSQSTNEVGISHNNLLAYQNLIQNQSSHKRKRTRRGQNSSSSGAFLLNNVKVIREQTAFQSSSEASTSTVNCQTPTLCYETDRLLWSTKDAGAAFCPDLAVDCYTSSMSKVMKRPRSRNPSKRQNLHQGYLMCGVLVDCKVQQHEPGTTIESLFSNSHATWTKKKRTKKRVDVVPLPTSTSNEKKQQGKVTMFNHSRFAATTSGAPAQLMWEEITSIDELVNQIEKLDINRESSEIDFRKVSAAYNIHHVNGQELVLYRRDGTIVPFEHVKKRRPRPKVELDEETNKVWKLLMESINKEGIDGTDEEKAKWWEGERDIFRGRTNSFIARMHLVQGDRHFSPWKGSVVDSVVGVFLTQNVSDHLSSSAFMSMAARFPIKLNEYQDCYEETTSSGTDKPIECIMDPDSPRQIKDMLNELSCDTSSLILHDTELDEEREPAKSDVSLASSIGSYSSKIVSDASCQVLIDGFNTEMVESRKHDCAEVLDDSQSSQASTVCDKQEFNFESADGSKLNFQQSCSFVELLRHASSSIGGAFNNQGNGILKGGDSMMMNGAASQIDTSSNQDDKNAESNSRFVAESVRQMTELDKPALVGEEAQNYPTMNDKLLYTAKGDENLGVHFQSNILKDFENDSASPPKPQNNDLHHRQSEALDSNDNNSASDILDINLLNTTESHSIGHNPSIVEQMKINEAKRKAKSRRVGNDIQDNFDWDALRKQVEPSGKKRERPANTMDSLDWEAVRCADVEEIANTIKDRGMNNVLAGRIKDFLNRLVREHGSIDLEWLRDIPPDKAKEYLLSIRGLGLKSVECVRLLTLHQLAFPVDTNVGRIAVRLGWVPLQPLPESLQLHLLEMYPVLESIQKYLWPRLCKLDQRTLYELHYQMITFGKVFCTKSKPNCNACPMRGECRHFASAFASARLALPGPEQVAIVSSTENRCADGNPAPAVDKLLLPPTQSSEQLEMELSKVYLQAKAGVCDCVPIVEEPASPEPECSQIMENDIEDFLSEDPDEIPTIKLNIKEFTQNLQNYMQQNMELQEGDMSKALVALTAEAASIPTPKLKNVSRLRTEHHVYELPDSHPLLQQLDRREPDDPCSYLLAIWTPGEVADSIEPPESRCSSQEQGALCDEETCFSCNSVRELNSQMIRGTLLIPCRTAMRGSFPLNGTYFQVNEVFADHDSSLNPIHVPRELIWNLPRRTVYFGTSIPSIFKGLTTEGIQHCFWRGFVCVRGFDQKSRAPRPLMARLHFPASKSTRGKKPEETAGQTKAKTTHQG